MSAFAKASANALVNAPSVNGVIDEVTGEIVFRNYVDISVAVATPKGLVVPVLRNVEKMNYRQVGTENDVHLKIKKIRKHRYFHYANFFANCLDLENTIFTFHSKFTIFTLKLLIKSIVSPFSHPFKPVFILTLSTVSPSWDREPAKAN